MLSARAEPTRRSTLPPTDRPAGTPTRLNMPSSPPADADRHSIDPAEPLRGFVVCCTSIPPEQRTEIGNKVAELGGIHKYDLTPDCTHLIVGNYDTPKYRHVARERPDVKAMDAAWIEALSELWRNDDDIDFWTLEKKYELKPLERCGASASSKAPHSLLVCLTGFGEEREQIAETIATNGGCYTGDLTRKCSHLIVSKPEGKKFSAAKSWGVHTVTLAWLEQTIARGMILDEDKFDPLLPTEEQGVGAWIKKDLKRTSLGKRSRSGTANPAEDGGRKLRKTASMKLNSQRNSLWGDILGRSTSREYSFARESPVDEPTQDAAHSDLAVGRDEPAGIFSNCVFTTHGCDEARQKVLEDSIVPLGGLVVRTLDEVVSYPAPAEPFFRFLIVPQLSQPDTHPPAPPDKVHVVTQYYIERCLHSKSFLHPNSSVFGRPFPRYPIPGFSDLTICGSSFTGIELNQVARSVAQLGARYDEEFKRTTSLVLCRSLPAMRKNKRAFALEWGVPVVSLDWLVECISTGCKVPIDDYIFPELKDSYVARRRGDGQQDDRNLARPSLSRPSEPTPTAVKLEAKPASPRGQGVDSTGFERDSAERSDSPKSIPAVKQEDTNTSADFMTARSRPVDTFARDSDAPLSELSSASINKSPSPPKHANAPKRTRSEPSTNHTAADKPARASRGPSAPPVDLAGETRKNTDADGGTALKVVDEEAKEKAKAAERQELASTIKSILCSTTASAAAGADRPGTLNTQAPPSRTRTRRILGRAISNVSNASSADGPETLRAPAVAAAAAADPDQDDPDDNGSLDAQAPPATQLQYGDDEARGHKQALMDRMRGGGGGDTLKATASAPAAVVTADGPAASSGRSRALRKR
ncbi:protein kinase activating protein dpb11 [Purpureocillium takamizusanense]|uniref:Protein kinase activating protein dpb11 n=1 Tax=Purpureocillium takamizusanense TaxID=2060973 RepID=A0A9Q8QEC3_9HYPO|nr:protein kinase activating protein dpb11 [Purpureocillium takamizusanense]UNI17182.1 protein kinase activating protein dpb11 [Purpureocillium takamizusanense]